MTIKDVLTKKLADPLTQIWTSVFLDVIGFSILFPFLPRFLLDRGASLPMIGFYLSINAFIGFFTGIIWGRLSDRFGRRPILIICRTGAIAGYILLALSTNLTMLLIARIVDGIFSRSVPVTLTVVGDIVHPERRSNEMSKIGIAWIVGGLVGPALGAILSANGFGLIGIFCAALSLTALAISLLTLKESKAQDSVRGTADKATAQTKQPVFSLSLLRQHNPAIMLGQNLFVFLAHFTFSTTMTLYITRQLGLSIAQIGGVFTTIGVINLLGRVTLFPLVLGRLRDRKTYTLGLMVYLAAFGWLMAATRLWEFMAITAMISFGTSCSLDVMNGIMSKSVRRREMGEMMGLNSAVESIALILGPMIGSYLLALPNIAFYGLASVASTLAAFMISRLPLGRLKKRICKVTNSGRKNVSKKEMNLPGLI